jgi:hypothetical protein
VGEDNTLHKELGNTMQEAFEIPFLFFDPARGKIAQSK